MDNNQQQGQIPGQNIIPSAMPKSEKNKLLPVVIVLAVLFCGALVWALCAILLGGVAKNNETVVGSNNETVAVVDVPKNLWLDDDKCLNNDDMSYGVELEDALLTYDTSSYTADPSIRSEVEMSIARGVGDDAWKMLVNWDDVNSMYSLDNGKTGYESLSITGPKGKVIDVMIARLGQAPGLEVIFFLLDDGTVEYIPVYKMLTENKYRTYGKLPGVESVVKLESGASSSREGFGAGADAVAIRADGYYYGLYRALSDAGVYY